MFINGIFVNIPPRYGHWHTIRTILLKTIKKSKRPNQYFTAPKNVLFATTLSTTCIDSQLKNMTKIKRHYWFRESVFFQLNAH